MSSIALSLFDELRPELEELVMEAVRTVLSDCQPRYAERVSVEQASEITGYSKNSLYQMHSRGQIPGAHKVGGKLMFETDVLREWVKTGATPAKRVA